MTLVDIITWLGILISISTSIVRAINIGYQKHTYVLSALSNIVLLYNAYNLGSSQLIILNIFHLTISVAGIYRWRKN